MTVFRFPMFFTVVNRDETETFCLPIFHTFLRERERGAVDLERSPTKGGRRRDAYQLQIWNEGREVKEVRELVCRSN